LSISGKYESIWKYETPNSSWRKYIAGGLSILNDLEEIGPGYGYWVNVEEDCTWDYGGAFAQSSPGLMLRKPPFILYGKITKDGFLIDNNEGHEVSIIIKNKKVSSYILNSNPRYEDYYVFEIPVDDSFREGDMAQLYVDGQQTNEAPLILGGIGKVRRYDLKYISIPADTNLLQNYPNPFNPDTWIPYQLKEDSNVVIRIYNATGLLVRSLNIGYRQRGFYISKDRAAYWDGRNEADELVASGIYFYTIQTGKYTSIRKMLLMK